MSSEIKYVLRDVLPVIQDVVLILLLIRGIWIYRRRKNATAGNLVSLPVLLLWVGGIGSALFSIPLTVFGLDSTQIELGVLCLFESLVLFDACFMLAFCNTTICFDDDCFEAGNLFGVKRRYNYGEITGLTREYGGVILYCGRKKIKVDEIASGSDDFIRHADKMVLRWQQHPIPLRKRGWDPLNGNLDSPWGFVMIWVFMMAAGIGFFVLSLQVILPADDRIPTNAQVIRTSFSSWERTKGKLVLHAEECEKPFLLEYLSGYEVPIPTQEKLCNGETYILTVKEYKENYEIYGISSLKNQTLLRPIDRNTAYRNDQYILAVLLGCFAIASFLFSFFGIVVGRHPERYPKNVREWFYQNWAWSDLGKERLHFNQKRKAPQTAKSATSKRKSPAPRRKS